MKKKFLLLMLLLLSGISVNAEDWIPVDTNFSSFYLYLDKDSIKNVSPQEYLYAIKFQSGNKAEKVAYLKSNIQTNYLGVVKSEIYDKDNYRPKTYFANAHVFMKPIDNDSFLALAHNYVSKLYNEEKTENHDTSVNVKKDAFTPDNKPNENIPVAKQEKQEDVKPQIRGIENRTQEAEKPNPVEEIKESNPQKTVQISQISSNAKDLSGYVEEISAELEGNWQPPKSGQNTQTIMILTIGKDGSLQKYDIAKSSGDEATDRSIISAAEKSVPYANFSGIKSGADNIKLQFVFEYKKFKKSVI